MIATALFVLLAQGDPAELLRKAQAASGDEYRTLRTRIVEQADSAKELLSSASDAPVPRAILDRMNRPDYYRRIDSEFDKVAQDKAKRPDLGVLQKLLLSEHPDAEGQRACILEILSKNLLPAGFSTRSRGPRGAFVESLYRFVFEQSDAAGTAMQRACRAFTQRLLDQGEDVDTLRLAIGYHGLQENPESRAWLLRLIREDRRSVARHIAVWTAAGRIRSLRTDGAKGKGELLDALVDIVKRDASPKLRAAAASALAGIAIHEPSDSEPGDSLQTLGKDVAERIGQAARARLIEESDREVLLALYELAWAARWPAEIRFERGTILRSTWTFDRGGETSEEAFKDLVEALAAEDEKPEWRTAAVVNSFRGILFLEQGREAERRSKLVSLLLGRIEREKDTAARRALLDGFSIWASGAREIEAEAKTACRNAFLKRLKEGPDAEERQALEALVKRFE